MLPGTRVRFVSTEIDDERVDFGRNDDPRPVLADGGEYVVASMEPHAWYTRIVLEGFPGLRFNSVHFEVL